MTKNADAFVSDLNLNKWILFDAIANRVLGEYPFASIPEKAYSGKRSRLRKSVRFPSIILGPPTWLRDLSDMLPRGST